MSNIHPAVDIDRLHDLIHSNTAVAASLGLLPGFTEEIWLPIPHSVGYEASNFGRIRSPRQILNPTTRGDGYQIVSVTWKGKGGVSKTVHSLIALTFYGERPDDREVGHWDGDKTHNGVFNLRYVTKAENADDNRRNGVQACFATPAERSEGEWTFSTHRLNAFSPEDQRKIAERIAAGGKMADIANDYGVSPSTVSKFWKRVAR